MDTSPRLYFRYVWCLFVVCCEICRGNIIATNVTGYGGDTTVFTCSSPDISPGDFYILRKDGAVIYRSTDEGTIVGEKYNATAEVGKINLNILNTNISDAGEYTCNHNFIDAPGTVSVAFRPENVTATTSSQEQLWKLSVSAYKVFPPEASITGASCLSPYNTVAVFQRENQVVNTNNEEQYLYDIFWDGTTNRTWSGDVQCNITIVVIDTVVRTINVSFQDTTTCTSSTSNRTSASTGSTPDDCEICKWCVIIPWCWCIVLLVIGALIILTIIAGICTLGYWKTKEKYIFDKLNPRWPCSSRNKSDGSDETENRPLSTTVETTNETSPETKSLQSTKHDGSQVNNQVVQTEGASPSPIKKGHSKVGPDDNQRSGDPEKNTAGSIREVNNERINTPRPLPILPKIGSKESSQAPNMGDVEANKPKKKKKKKKGKETKEDQIV